MSHCSSKVLYASCELSSFSCNIFSFFCWLVQALAYLRFFYTSSLRENISSSLSLSLEDELLLPCAIWHTREELDDECLCPRLLWWSSSSLEESSHDLIDVRALSLHAFFVLGVVLFGQTSAKCPNSPHPKHPFFLCSFLWLVKMKS